MQLIEKALLQVLQVLRMFSQLLERGRIGENQGKGVGRDADGNDSLRSSPFPFSMFATSSLQLYTLKHLTSLSQSSS